MTNCNLNRGAFVCSQGLYCLILIVGGCGAGASSSQPKFTIKVAIDQRPVENVRVALAVKGDPDGTILLEGITDHMGSAAMRLKDDAVLSSTPTKYAVLCESLGDWQVAKPWSDVFKTPLTVTWPSCEPLMIALPVKAARPL